MPYPIDSFDLLDIVLQKEITAPQAELGISNIDTITIDNRGNIQQNPIIIITLNDDFTSGFTVKNNTTNISVTIPNPPVESKYDVGTIFKIYHDSVYQNDNEINVTFSAPFIIAENFINTLSFTLPADVSIDASVSWLHPSPVEVVIGYVEEFSINEVRTQRKGTVNLLNKYTNSYVTQDIAYDFSIDKLYLNSWFHDERDYSYRLKWQTDSDIDDINQITTYLCGCKFNNFTWSQVDNEVVKENIRGTALKKIKD